MNYPIEKIWQVILDNAWEAGSPSIHIEPFSTHTQVRYRCEKDLNSSLCLPKETHSKLLAYIKSFLGFGKKNINTIESGRGEYKSGKIRTNLRIEFLPTLEGEKIFIHLPDLESALKKEEVFSIKEEELIQDIKNLDQGLILFNQQSKGLFEEAIKNMGRTEKTVVLLTNFSREKIKGVKQIVLKPEIGLNGLEALELAAKHSADVIFLSEIMSPELIDKISTITKKYLMLTFCPFARFNFLKNWLKFSDVGFPLKDYDILKIVKGAALPWARNNPNYIPSYQLNI